MNATNYHNETVTFAVGQTITLVTDEGAIIKGTVKSLIAPDALEIDFEDGNEGTELTTSCF